MTEDDILNAIGILVESILKGDMLQKVTNRGREGIVVSIPTDTDQGSKFYCISIEPMSHWISGK